MKVIRSLLFFPAISLAILLGAQPCSAQKDPEAVARQAEIDTDEARSKIQELQEQQAGFADVQSEATTEMAARDAQIGEVEKELAADEQPRLAAERAER
jgi:hypothetical protein